MWVCLLCGLSVCRVTLKNFVCVVKSKMECFSYLFRNTSRVSWLRHRRGWKRGEEWLKKYADYPGLFTYAKPVAGKLLHHCCNSATASKRIFVAPSRPQITNFTALHYVVSCEVWVTQKSMIHMQYYSTELHCIETGEGRSFSHTSCIKT